MPQNKTIESFDEDGADFNIDTFFSSLFDTLQSFRSSMSLQEGQVIESPTENSGAKNTESNLNAFYRLLGLPAVRSDISSLPSNINEEILSHHRTLNYFPDFKIDGESVAEKATARENQLYKKLEYQESIDIIRDPLFFTASVIDSPRRASIFPMVVNAAVPIYPMARRTAPLFNDGEFYVASGKRKLTRPFLEHLIYMRTKVFSGFDAYSDQLKQQIKTELEITNKASSENNSNTTTTTELLANIDKNTLLQLRMTSKLLRALKRSAETFKEVEELIERLRKDIDFLPSPKTNPAEKSGNLPSSITDNLVKDDISAKGLEAQITSIKSKMAAEDLFLKLLPSNFIIKSDKVKRPTDVVIDSNVSDDVFLSEFNYLTTFERTEYTKQLKDAEDRKARLIAQYEEAKRTLLYLNGQVTGLSIFDVICIFLALFTVDLDSLLAIINIDSLNNLKNSDLYYKTNPGEVTPTQSTNLFTDIRTNINGATSLGAAAGLKNIQDKVRENFKLAEAFYQRAKKSGENRE